MYRQEEHMCRRHVPSEQISDTTSQSAIAVLHRSPHAAQATHNTQCGQLVCRLDCTPLCRHATRKYSLQRRVPFDYAYSIH